MSRSSSMLILLAATTALCLEASAFSRLFAAPQSTTEPLTAASTGKSPADELPTAPSFEQEQRDLPQSEATKSVGHGLFQASILLTRLTLCHASQSLASTSARALRPVRLSLRI